MVSHERKPSRGITKLSVKCTVRFLSHRYRGALVCGKTPEHGKESFSSGKTIYEFPCWIFRKFGFDFVENDVEWRADGRGGR